MSQEAIQLGAIGGDEVEPEHPDVVLMKRLESGESTAMTELVERFGPQLNRLVGRLAKPSSDREDLLQDVFLTAWQKASTYRGGSLEGWLRRLAVNKTRNHHRARETFARALERLAVRLRSSAKRDSRNEAETALQDALSRLHHDDRAVLVLYYLEQLDSEQIAEALGIRVNALHVRLHRARQRLRLRLEAEQETHE